MEYLVTMTTFRSVPQMPKLRSYSSVRCALTPARRGSTPSPSLASTPCSRAKWRTLGLFAAVDAADLEGVLASMPWGVGH